MFSQAGFARADPTGPAIQKRAIVIDREKVSLRILLQALNQLNPLKGPKPAETKYQPGYIVYVQWTTNRNKKRETWSSSVRNEDFPYKPSRALNKKQTKFVGAVKRGSMGLLLGHHGLSLLLLLALQQPGLCHQHP